MNRATLIMLTSLLLSMILIPSALVAILPSPKGPLKSNIQTVSDGVTMKLYKKAESKVVTIPLEEYVKGVVAAEMPATFAMEALKAQAIAARTNVVRRISMNVLTPEGAHVNDDYKSFQAYSDDETLKKRWGIIEYPINMSKIVQAVDETKGQILTYDGQPIEAFFFSTSNGYTENSQDYWGKAYPYLRSIPSPWDKNAKHATDTQKMALSELNKDLGIQAVPAMAASNSFIKILSRSESGRVTKVQVAGKSFTGPQFREALGLFSNDFSWTVQGDQVTFTTHGYGHGVGMSQYGADGMAHEGNTAEQILHTFYQGVNIVTYPK